MVEVDTQTTAIYSDFRFNQISINEGLSQSSVLSICQDNYGYIWMGTKDGLNRYDGYKYITHKNQPGNIHSISNNEIVCIENTSSGDLLIGTRGGGLNKYDYESNLFYHPKGEIIPRGTVQTIYQENDSVIWVGTLDGLFRGVETDSNEFGYVFSNVLINSIYYDASGQLIPHLNPHTSFVSIIKSGDKDFLVGTEEGVFLYDNDKSVFRKLDIKSINESKINSIIRRSEKEYVFGTGDGIVIGEWDGQNIKPVQIYNSYQTAPHWLNISWTNKILIRNNNEIWGGTRGGGFFKIDTLNRLSTYYSSSTLGNSIKDYVINTLFIDKTGVLWLGTESQGAFQLDLNRKKFNHFVVESSQIKHLNSILITAISGSGNEIFTGTAYNGISKVVLHDNQTCTVDANIAEDILKDYNDEIIALLCSSDKTLWVGSANNIISGKRRGEKGFHYQTEGFVYSLYEDKEGDIWYGTWGGGLGIIDVQKDQHYVFNRTSGNYQSLSSDIVLCIFEDNSGHLWIGTKGGGLNCSPIRFLKQNIGSFASYNFDSNVELCLSHNDVYCIYQDSNEDIWIGTGNGLNKIIFPDNLDKSEAIMQGKLSFISYTQDQGLPSNVIYGILEDDNKNLWISTVKGLAKMDLNTLDITSYDVNDGLINNEFHSNASYKDANGNMFFGGINGISFFNPKEIKPNPFDASVVITGLKVNNIDALPGLEILDKVILEKNINTTKSITLLSRHKDFSIEVSAMHYSNVNNVRYRYRLLGFNDEWREMAKKEHTVNYTNIFDGDYLFQVQATNNDGKWSDSTAELQIIIKPPFWRKPISFLIYVGFMVVLLFFFRKYSIIGAKEKSRLKLEAFEQKKTIELTEAKTRFFTNISHEIRSPLTLIYSPLDYISKEEKLSLTGKNNLRVIKKNVDRLLLLTNQLIQLRKIDIGLIEPEFEKVKLSSYIKDILEYFDKIIEVKQLEVVCANTISDDNDSFYFDKGMITTALYNLISNSIKYTPVNGEIKIEIFKSNQADCSEMRYKKRIVQDYISFRISDNGQGIPPHDLPNIFNRFYQAKANQNDLPGSGIGLSIVKEYIDLHDGCVSAKNISGKGASFLIQIPAITNYDTSKEKKDTRSIKDIIKEEKTSVVVQNSVNPVKPIHVDKTDIRPLLLIADDDNEIGDFLLDNLKELYQVIIVRDGSQAWNIVQKHRPNLIVSDIMMPGMSGTELCSLIKKDPTLRHIPFILLSAHASNEDIIQGYEHGADRYISKPFSIDLLKAQISQLLNTRQQLIELYSRKVLLKPRDFTITPTDEKFLTKIMDLIEQNMADPEFDITSIVDKMNMSYSLVLKNTKELTGYPLVEFLRRYRLNKAAMIFEKDKLSVSEVAYMTGFSDPKYFSRCFAKQFGVTPSKYIDKIYNTDKISN